MADPKSKNAAMIIAFRDFQDVEYLIPRNILESNNVKVKVASNNKGLALGVYGGEAKVDMLLEDLRVNDFDVIIFVGGGGCLKHLDNEKSYNIAREAVEKDKLLASICISPVILSRAGVLKGKKVTVWTSQLDKSPVNALKLGGANYLDEDVVVDGNIITASGPFAAESFGEKIVESLS